MDKWFVAVAAGAGLFSKLIRNNREDKESSFSSDDNNLERLESRRKAVQGERFGKDITADRTKDSGSRFYDAYWFGGDSAPEVASSSTSTSASPYLLPQEAMNVIASENGKGNRERRNSRDNYCARLPDLFEGDIRFIYRSPGTRISLRKKGSYGHLLKPLTSQESCLMAQLYKEHAEMREYVFSSFPSPSMPTTRKLLISDGNQIIGDSIAHSDISIGPQENKMQNQPYINYNETPCGISAQPNVELPTKKRISRKNLGGGLSTSRRTNHGECFNAEEGPLNGSLIFLLGFSMGVMSSFIVNKGEVSKLKELVKHTENLVEDLQEELELKELLTVKELVNENHHLQDTCNDFFQDMAPDTVSSERYANNLNTCHELYHKTSEESSDSMRKIEAELEAELERLGLNMNTSDIVRRSSNLAEIDPDAVPAFAEGDLRVDLSDGQAVSQNASSREYSHGVVTTPANYAVSPQELSLRLHEVIQARLQERVNELEMALQDSQRKVQLMKSERKPLWKFTDSNLGSSPLPESTFTREECDSVVQPLVMNISGNALDAYNEAYEELVRVSESEEDSPSCFFEYQQIFKNKNCQLNDPSKISNEGTSRNSLSCNVLTLENPILRMHEFDELSFDDEKDCSSDESDRLLIKQILEKTKKGSPMILKAKRVLLSED